MLPDDEKLLCPLPQPALPPEKAAELCFGAAEGLDIGAGSRRPPQVVGTVRHAILILPVRLVVAAVGVGTA